MKALLATVPRGACEAIAAVVRTIFAQPDHATAMTQLRQVGRWAAGRFAQAAALLQDAAEDILAYRHVPMEHKRQLHSTNPLERLNKEIKRRAVAERRYFSGESMKQLTAPTLPATAQEIFVAIA